MSLTEKNIVFVNNIQMRNLVTVFIIEVMLLFLANNSLGKTNGLKDDKGSDNKETDTLKAKVGFGTFKINTVPFLFDEIPVSFEVFLRERHSIQLQIGYIFPKEENSMSLFQQGIHEVCNGILGHRMSPYLNYGLSMKLEFRKYRNFFYYGPQVMYKHTYYHQKMFPVEEQHRTMDQTESKVSNIIGAGYAIGWQFYAWRITFDCFSTAGLKLHIMDVTILQKQYFNFINEYPNEKSSKTMLYPFINIGIRLGIKL